MITKTIILLIILVVFIRTCYLLVMSGLANSFNYLCDAVKSFSMMVLMMLDMRFFYYPDTIVHSARSIGWNGRSLAFLVFFAAVLILYLIDVAHTVRANNAAKEIQE